MPVFKIPAAMRYIFKAESYKTERGKEKKRYCVIAGSAVYKGFLKQLFRLGEDK
jgi:hypothetical protein